MAQYATMAAAAERTCQIRTVIRTTGRALAVAGLAMLAGVAWTASPEVDTQTDAEFWACYDYSASGEVQGGPIVELARGLDGTESDEGFVEVVGAGIQLGDFAVEGLDRTWRFGRYRDGISKSYAFLISPDGTGLYFDRNNTDRDGKVKAAGQYSCQRKDLVDESALRQAMEKFQDAGKCNRECAAGYYMCSTFGRPNDRGRSTSACIAEESACQNHC